MTRPLSTSMLVAYDGPEPPKYIVKTATSFVGHGGGGGGGGDKGAGIGRLGGGGVQTPFRSKY